MHRVRIVALLFIILAVSGGASAQEFGEQGQVVPSGSIAFSHQKVQSGASYYGWAAMAAGTSFTFAPGVLAFAAPNLAIGGELMFTLNGAGTGEYSTTTAWFGLAPTVGYHIRLGSSSSFGWFPKYKLVFEFMGSSVGGEASGTYSTFGMEFDMPLLFHVVPHMFIGFGPNIAFDLASNYSYQGDSTPGNTSFAFQMRTVIGGWF